MKNLILIPARSGSTRVKNKNLREIGGKPLVAHAIEAGLKAGSARVVVSTNSEEIAEVAKSYGAEVPFLRPPELATETSTSLSTIFHALVTLKEQGFEPDLLAFCPPTNPMVKPDSIATMFEKLSQRTDKNSIVTITKPKTHPFRVVKQFDDGAILNGIVDLDGKTINDIERSQDWPVVYEGSPACRMTRSNYFWALFNSVSDPYHLNGKTYDVEHALGHEVSPLEAMDIDDESDFVVANALMSK